MFLKISRKFFRRFSLTLTLSPVGGEGFSARERGKDRE
jgi:hypothetical protein